MLVNKKLTNKGAAPDEKQSRSKLWLLIVLAVFFVLIILPLWFLLKLGILYLPGLSNWIFEPAAFTYEVEPSLVTERTLMNNFTMDSEYWYISLNEGQSTYLLNEYLGEDWQIIVENNGFELYGPLMSAVNNPDQKSFVKILYTQEEEGKSLDVYINDVYVPRFLSHYLLNKYLLKEDGTAAPYFENLRLEDKKVVVYGQLDTWQDVFNNIDYNVLMEQFINYFLAE